jgi:hypothetical protein
MICSAEVMRNVQMKKGYIMTAPVKVSISATMISNRGTYSSLVNDPITWSCACAPAPQCLEP